MNYIDNYFNLSDKVVAITGGAGFLCSEMALGFHHAGCAVSVLDSNLGGAEKIVKTIENEGGKAIALEMNASKKEDFKYCLKEVVKEFGQVDILVNGAGINAPTPFLDITEEEWDDCMAVNVKGVWNSCRVVVPTMRKCGGGSIINMASLAATYGLPFCLHYTASKAAVIGITRGLARELGRHWIRVNAVAPSAVATEGTRDFFGDKFEHATEVIRSNQSLRRTLEPADVAGQVVYLASDASRFVTGQTLMVDGGTTLL